MAWALVIQALFNDSGIADHLNDFGMSVRKEPDFRELVGRLAVNRVLPILRDLLSDFEYEEWLQEQAYDFLRTKEAYRRSMEIAHERVRSNRLPI